MYQFAAMIGLPNGLTFFDFGFIRTFGMEDLFFFFWSSRPITVVCERGEVVVLNFHLIEISILDFFRRATGTEDLLFR